MAVRECKPVCTNTCTKARNGHCTDGWVGDDHPEGKPSCTIGSDCQDCGVRDLCTVSGGNRNLLLPRDVVAQKPPAALRPVQVLFMILGSSRLRARSTRAHSGWCRSVRGVRCLFFADDEPPWTASAVANESMPLVIVSRAQPPKRCCQRRSHHYRSFFCDQHRESTLAAQYRFLPALQHVQTSAAFASGAFKWLILVDDDSHVNVQRLLWILARLDETKAICSLGLG